MKVFRNSVTCLGCNDKIESKTFHDFVTCMCGNVSTDGGRDFIRRVFRGKAPTKDTSITERDVHFPYHCPSCGFYFVPEDFAQDLPDDIDLSQFPCPECDGPIVNGSEKND